MLFFSTINLILIILIKYGPFEYVLQSDNSSINFFLEWNTLIWIFVLFFIFDISLFLLKIFKNTLYKRVKVYFYFFWLLNILFFSVIVIILFKIDILEEYLSNERHLNGKISLGFLNIEIVKIFSDFEKKTYILKYWLHLNLTIGLEEHFFEIEDISSFISLHNYEDIKIELDKYFTSEKNIYLSNQSSASYFDFLKDSLSSKTAYYIYAGLFFVTACLGLGHYCDMFNIFDVFGSGSENIVEKQLPVTPLEIDKEVKESIGTLKDSFEKLSKKVEEQHFINKLSLDSQETINNNLIDAIQSITSDTVKLFQNAKTQQNYNNFNSEYQEENNSQLEKIYKRLSYSNNSFISTKNKCENNTKMIKKLIKHVITNGTNGPNVPDKK